MQTESVIREALRWYIDDRASSARKQENRGFEEDAETHEEQAEQAEQVLESLQADNGGITITNQGPAAMISPDGDHEEMVSLSQFADHITIETRDGKQIVVDIGNDGQLRADFSAPSGPAGGDAETHVELATDDISVTNNF